MIALALLFDGFDNQALALAIPSMMVEWRLPREDFANVLSIGFVGMALGTAFGGSLGDRIGRKPALLASVFGFGALTIAVALVQNLTELTFVRFAGGVALGAAVPNAAALISETTPAQRRSLAVTLGALCIGVGGLVGGLVAAWVLPAFGWRMLFLIGGTVPIAIAAVQYFTMPESPRFLATVRRDMASAASVLHRFGVVLPQGTSLVDRSSTLERAAIPTLFTRFYRRDTIALWAAFFFTLFSLYSLISWLPSVFASAGFPLTMTSTSLALYNLGGITGALGGAWAIAKFGSRLSLGTMAVAGGVGAAILALIPLAPTTASPVLALITFEGLCIGGLQVTLYAVGTHMYEPAVRATGLGWAVGFGRTGAILSPIAASAALSAVGAAGLFGMVAVLMMFAAASLLIISRHVPRPTGS